MESKEDSWNDMICYLIVAGIISAGIFKPKAPAIFDNFGYLFVGSCISFETLFFYPGRTNQFYLTSCQLITCILRARCLKHTGINFDSRAHCTGNCNVFNKRAFCRCGFKLDKTVVKCLKVFYQIFILES